MRRLFVRAQGRARTLIGAGVVLSSCISAAGRLVAATILFAAHANARSA